MTALGKLEIGVVGCGQHSRYHLQHYDDFPAAEVVALTDVDRARQVAGEFAVPHHYGDYRSLPRMAATALGPEGGQGECDIEDFNTGLVHFENGATMSLESNWLTHPGGRSSGGEFLGDLGVASLRPLRINLQCPLHI